MNALPPLQSPRPNAGASIDWDKPTGYGHAASILQSLSLAN